MHCVVVSLTVQACQLFPGWEEIAAGNWDTKGDVQVMMLLQLMAVSRIGQMIV